MTLTAAERAFHAKRRMFAIINETIILAEAGTEEGHREWFLRAGILTSRQDSAFETIVRGYSDGKDIYAYRGANFEGDLLVITALKRHAPALRQTLGLPTARLYAGLTPGTLGQKWLPKQEVDAEK